MNKKNVCKFVTTLVMALVFTMTIQGLEGNAKSQVRLSKKSLSLKIGQKFKLKMKGTKKKVKWNSSNKKVAMVSKKGIVKAKKVGKTKITAKINKKKYVCKVTVKAVVNKKVDEIVNNKETNSTQSSEPSKIDAGKIKNILSSLGLEKDTQIDVKVEKNVVIITATNNNIPFNFRIPVENFSSKVKF